MKLSAKDKEELIAIAVKMIKLSDDFMAVGTIEDQINNSDPKLDNAYYHIVRSWGFIVDDLLGMSEDQADEFVELHSKKPQ